MDQNDIKKLALLGLASGLALAGGALEAASNNSDTVLAGRNGCGSNCGARKAGRSGPVADASNRHGCGGCGGKKAQPVADASERNKCNGCDSRKSARPQPTAMSDSSGCSGSRGGGSGGCGGRRGSRNQTALDNDSSTPSAFRNTDPNNTSTYRGNSSTPQPTDPNDPSAFRNSNNNNFRRNATNDYRNSTQVKSNQGGTNTSIRGYIQNGRFIADASGDENAQQYGAYHLYTEAELLDQLDARGKALYLSLNDEGKALARELASQQCGGLNTCKGRNACRSDSNDCAGKASCKGKSKCAFENKNKAVEVAAEKMKDKRSKAMSQ